MRKALRVALAFAACGAFGAAVAAGAGTGGNGGAVTGRAGAGSAVRVGVSYCLPRTSLTCSTGSSMAQRPVVVVMRCTEQTLRAGNCPEVVVRYRTRRP